MWPDGGKRRVPDARHVEQGFRRGEWPVGIAVGDDPGRNRGPQAGQLGQLIGSGLVDVDREPHRSGRGRIVIDEAAAADEGQPHGAADQASGHNHGEERLHRAG